MNSNTLHVILGSGPVGLAVMRELCAKGQRVRIVNRRGHASGVAEGVEVVALRHPVDDREAGRRSRVSHRCGSPSTPRRRPRCGAATPTGSGCRPR